MKNLKVALLATVAASALAGGVLAQTLPPPASNTPPAAPLAPPQPVFDPAQLPATHGTLRFFTLTPRGDLDGFVLADGTQVHMPPHLSAQLAAAVKPGDAVTVRGLRAMAVPMVAAMSVTNDASGQTVVDAGPGGPRPPRGPGEHGPGERGPGRGPREAGTPADVSGKVLTVLHGPRGEANGAMLEDGTVLRLPPPEAARLLASLQPGAVVFAQGPGLANTLGRVVEVRQFGTSRDAMTPVRAPRPPRDHGGPEGDRRGPPPPA